MIEDGAALVQFYTWLYSTLRNGGAVTKLATSRKLESGRAEFDGYRYISFESIMGYGPDGALNHYSVDKESVKPVLLEKLSPLLNEEEQAWLEHECRAI